MAYNKVIYDGNTLIDLTDTTATTDKVLNGSEFYDAAGVKQTGTIPTKSQSDLTVSGPTVNIPSGYYSSNVSKSIPNGVFSTIDTNNKPSISVNSSTGVITASNSGYTAATPVSTGGYFSTTDGFRLNYGGSNTSQLSVQSATTITPTEQSQTAVASGKYTTGDVTVDAIPSTYVGSGIAQRTSSSLTVSGPTVSAPSGYYSTNVSKSVASGSATTPDTEITVSTGSTLSPTTGKITWSATKTQDITPDVTEGYVTEGTAGTVTVSVSGERQLPTQAGVTINPTEEVQTAVEAGKYTLGNIKVGAISSTYVGSDIPSRTSADLTSSGATVSVPSGYYGSETSKSVATGTASTPATTITANPSISINASGLITATSSASKSVTPTVSAGYVSSGTAGTITVSGSNTSQLTVQAAKTVTPTKSSQTAVAAGRYTTGAVTVAAIPAEYITTSDATAAASDITYGKTAYVNGSKITGSDKTYVINLFKINDLWTPDRSIGDIVDANDAGMVLMLLINGSTSITGNVVSVTSNTLWYTIVENNTSTVTVYDYYYNSSGAHIDYSQILYRTTDSTASSSDVMNGKTFYNSTGKVTGTLSFITYYTGTSTPASSLGSDGDIYLKTS